MALKPAQLAWEETLLRERLKFLKELKTELQQPDGSVAQTVQAYTSLIDGGHHYGQAAVWAGCSVK